MFRLAVIALCLACTLCSLRPFGVAAAEEPAAEIETETEQKHYATVVHSSPYFSSASIGQMENGTEIRVMEVLKDFYKVDCYDMSGYIARSQVSINDMGRYYVNCDPASAESMVLNYIDHAEALELRNSLLNLAKRQLGSAYVYGANRPGAFDCSGLTYYLYGQNDFSIHRTASTQMQDGIIVAKEGLQVGDLIFFREYGEVTLASHVGIYVGNNQIIHSGSNGVEYADLDATYFYEYYLCARRIVNTDAVCLTAESPEAIPMVTPITTGRRGSR